MTNLRIHLLTGLAWTKHIDIKDATMQDDIMACIDGYYSEMGELPVPMYDMIEDDLNEEDMEQMIPINGGEFWIEGIAHIEEFYHEMTEDYEDNNLKENY